MEDPNATELENLEEEEEYQESAEDNQADDGFFDYSMMPSEEDFEDAFSF